MRSKEERKANTVVIEIDQDTMIDKKTEDIKIMAMKRVKVIELMRNLIEEAEVLIVDHIVEEEVTEVDILVEVEEELK